MSMQDETQALVHVQGTLDLAEGAVRAYPPPHRANLRSAIETAQAELERLKVACHEHEARGNASCMDEPSAAVATAGSVLGQSLTEVAQAFAVKRRIIPPDDPDRRPQCVPQPICPHRGGDAHHDLCADREPPNRYPGCDVLLNDKLFDALNGNGEMWEVKTDAWSKYSPFLRNVTVAAHMTEALLEHDIAFACRYPFVLAIADASLHDVLSRKLKDIIDVRHVPRCTR
jgi:hypothetical protein